MATPRDPNPAARILVNGKPVPANAFIQEFIGEAVIAMVGKLKRTDGDIRTVELCITREA